MNVGENIRNARKRAGLTQEQLGEKVGVTGVTIMRYEKEQREPRHKQLEALAKAINIPVETLLTGQDTAAPASAAEEDMNHVLHDRSNRRGLPAGVLDVHPGKYHRKEKTEMLKIEIDQNQHAELIAVLEVATSRLEAEAAAFASLGYIGKELTAERITQANTARCLLLFMLEV